MFSNYVKIAIRSILKNKLYAVINILGLTMGLAIYIFGGLLSQYEFSHDFFFKNYENVYTVRGIFNAEAGVGITQSDGVQSAIAPIIEADLSEVTAVARTIRREFLISVGEDSYYQNVRFTDPGFVEIFDFDYIYGDATALNNTTSVIITETIAQKYFGGENPVGKSITLDHEHDVNIGAVIRDVPINSHFASLFIMPNPVSILIPIGAMERITDFIPNENWGDLSMGNLTYIMLPEHLDINWLQTQMDGIFERHYPEERKEIVSELVVEPLSRANSAFWDALGIPAITIVETLGLLVLIVACVNYTNLATAQSMGRAREVGLRKTLGAGRFQLLCQFIIESLTITLFALVLALTILEIIIPLFNDATGKILSVSYIEVLPWLLLTTVLVGIIAGSYPAYVITKTSPIDALRDSARKGRSASWIRGGMIAVQFIISVFMLAVMLVIQQQNTMVENSSNIFPKEQIYTLDRLNVDQLTERQEALRNEILNIPYVDNFTFSSQVPYEQNNNTWKASTNRGDFTNSITINQMNIDQEYVDTYDIPIIAGRNISLEVALDMHVRGRKNINALVNEAAVEKLGFSSPEDAIGKEFYEDDDEEVYTYTIIGVTENRNILGFHNQLKPFVFFMRDTSYRLASIKILKNAPANIVSDIEGAWKSVYPDYPMQGRFLNETFEQVYTVFKLGSQALAAFAVFSLFLAAIGLFGLAAFMAEQKTKEIGIRKVLGAETAQIIQLLIWQFSKPVLWATPIALILAYLASYQYLEFFAERISLPYGMLIGAGIGGLVLSWATVSIHAYNVAKTNPVNALYHE